MSLDSPPAHSPEAHSAEAGRRAASVALAVGVLAIGWSAILVRWSGVAGMVSAFYRLAFAAIILLVWRTVATRAASRPPIPRSAKLTAVFSGVVFAADLAFFNSSIMMTTAANATLLGCNAPIFVGLGGWLLFGDRPTARFWLGFGLAVVGVLSIVGADVVLHPSFGFGDLLAVLGALSYGIYLLYVQRARTAMDTLSFAAWCVTSGAITLLIVCLVAHEPLVGYSARTWMLLITLSLVTQIVGHLSVAYALGHLPVTFSSIVLLGQAPLTALLAWPLLGEPLRAGQLLGGVLVLAGIAVVNVTRHNAQEVVLNEP